MTEEETQKLEDRLKAAIAEQVKITVNGKLDRQHAILEKQNEKMDAFITKHESDMEQIKPFMQVATGARLLSPFLTWVAKSAVWVVSAAVLFLTYKSLIK